MDSDSVRDLTSPRQKVYFCLYKLQLLHPRLFFVSQALGLMVNLGRKLLFGRFLLNPPRLTLSFHSLLPNFLVLFRFIARPRYSRSEG